MLSGKPTYRLKGKRRFKRKELVEVRHGEEEEPWEPVDLSGLRGRVPPGSELAQVIGNIVIAANEAQQAIFALFQRLSGLRDEAAEAVFYEVRSDSTQRQMTLALAKAQLKEKPELLEETKSLFKYAKRLADRRDAAIHTAWQIELETYKPRPSEFRSKHSEHVTKEDFMKEFKELREEFLRLADTFYDLEGKISTGLN